MINYSSSKCCIQTDFYYQLAGRGCRFTYIIIPLITGQTHLVREAIQDIGGVGEVEGWSEVQ